MGDNGSKHDQVLNRIHLWVAILGGIVALAVGLYNFKNIFFSSKTADKPAVEVHSETPQRTSAVSSRTVTGGNELSLESFLPMDGNGDGKVHESEWRGTHENFSLLDLDGNGVLNSQDFKGDRFEDMDKNGDGSITRLEWRKARRSFDMLDTDADGRIDIDEYSVRQKAAE